MKKISYYEDNIHEACSVKNLWLELIEIQLKDKKTRKDPLFFKL